MKRLNKFISETGICSRREADAWIAAGRVTINGKRAELGTPVGEGDEVRVDGRVVGTAAERPPPVYIALNKPVGITCTTERHIDGNIVDFVDHPQRIFPIGRLDKDSNGLILLTNDGDIVNEVLRAEHGHEKEYVVGVDRPLTDEFLGHMARGVRISDGLTRPCKIWSVGPKTFRIILTQGLNRQIRKMCEALGYEVVALQRVRIMHIELGNLKLGSWRDLTADEVQRLHPTVPRPKQAPGPVGPPRAAGAPRAAGPGTPSGRPPGPPAPRPFGSRPGRPGSGRPGPGPGARGGPPRRGRG